MPLRLKWNLALDAMIGLAFLGTVIRAGWCVAVNCLVTPVVAAGFSLRRPHDGAHQPRDYAA